jgi:hypothetical protein
MRNQIVAAALAALVLLSLPSHGVAGEEGPAPLRPNLRPMPLGQQDVHIQYKPEGGSRRLRFSTDILNRGKGPFELGPRDNERCAGAPDGYIAHQRVFFDLNDNAQYDLSEHVDPRVRKVGCFMYHPPHDHWHFQDFADYALYKIKPDGTMRKRAVDRADKVSFCMLDTSSVDWNLAGKPGNAQYGPNGCRSDDPNRIDHLVSGISVGWFDNYRRQLPGQSLDIAGLDRGAYCLSIHIDPLDKLAETIDRDNLRMTWLEIESRESVRVRPYKECPPL